MPKEVTAIVRYGCRCYGVRHIAAVTMDNEAEEASPAAITDATLF